VIDTARLTRALIGEIAVGAFGMAMAELGPEAIEAEEVAAGRANPCGLCFPAGTPVETRHGRVPIEKIKVGDEVLSRNMETGKLEYKKVTALTKPHQDTLLELKIDGERESIRTTPSHPFWVKHGDSTPAWVKAGDMRLGDEVFTEKGTWETVNEDAPIAGQQTVYNFEVQDHHDYFVGSPGLLVHNQGPCNWGNPNTLARHFFDHGADFGSASPDEYANQASDFFQQAQQDGLPTKIDSDGVIRVYDPASNTFGSYNPDGTTKTFFTPSSPTYWSRQPGVPPTVIGGP
jgi:hypothetical protein